MDINKIKLFKQYYQYFIDKQFNKSFLTSSFGKEGKFLQQTIEQKVVFSGVGLHSGQTISATLLPAPVNTGIIFRRVDLDPVVEIPAQAQYFLNQPLCSTLIKDNVKVSTVEHLLSTLMGLGIDNLIIELSASEVPILDGSSMSFVYLLQQSGTLVQKDFKSFIRIKQPVYVQQDDKWVWLTPHDGLKFNFHIEFDHPLIQGEFKNVDVEFSTQNYINKIAKARTFGFIHEFDLLRKNNLALGANLDNAVAVDEFTVLNENGLRYDDEFVRHKILDAIGDLYLLGHPVIGSYRAYKASHALNNALVQKVLYDKDCWEIVKFNQNGKLISNKYLTEEREKINLENLVMT